ncbi:MAG TPA: hypothetical protein VGF85_02465 [Opitutaceae bacterium]
MRFPRPGIRLAAVLLSIGLSVRADDAERPPATFPNIPKDYLREADAQPDFWVSTVGGVADFLKEQVHRGTVTTLGQSAGGRPIRAVFYGRARSGRGTTTFSGGLGSKDLGAYYGPDFGKKVYMAMGSVHGGEFEGIVGLVNLISVMETGKDLRGRPWPGITEAAGRIDRVIVIPIVNMDGRARVPLRMEAFRGTEGRIAQFFNTGAWSDGSLIGYPAVKTHIPLDFSRTMFPGGYPNDNGVNLMHDDFLGACQPETRALLELTARERPDLILNLHTGAADDNYFTRMLMPVMEEALRPAFKGLYRAVHTALALDGMQDSKDPAVEADPAFAFSEQYNLNTALDLNCGALSVTVESPSHGYAGKNKHGELARHTADQLLDEQLTVQQEAMRYLADCGGRSRWAPTK